MDKIMKKTNKAIRDLYISGQINDEVATEIIAQLDLIKKEDLEIYQDNLARKEDSQIPYEPINIIINSPGGYVSSGCAIINMLEECISPIHIHGVGEVCSMAVYIYACGDVRTAGDLVTFGLHGTGGGVGGYTKEMVNTLENCKRIKNKLDDKLIKATKFTKEDMERCETCFDFLGYEEALEKGLITLDVYDEDTMLELMNEKIEDKKED